MVVFKSRKVKKVKKLKKKKTIHTKYKYHRRTLKQPKHKSYNAIQPYYNVNNRLGGAPNVFIHISPLQTAKYDLIDIVFDLNTRVSNHQELDETLMNKLLTDLFHSYENIETYEDKLKFIDIFNELFIGNYIENRIWYKHWFKYIITRIEDEEIDYARNYDTTPANSVIQLLLFDEITKSKTMIDSAQ
jgi:hypothetical protein